MQIANEIIREMHDDIEIRCISLGGAFAMAEERARQANLHIKRMGNTIKVDIEQEGGSTMPPEHKHPGVFFTAQKQKSDPNSTFQALQKVAQSTSPSREELIGIKDKPQQYFGQRLERHPVPYVDAAANSMSLDNYMLVLKDLPIIKEVYLLSDERNGDAKSPDSVVNLLVKLLPMTGANAEAVSKFNDDLTQWLVNTSVMGASSVRVNFQYSEVYIHAF